MVRLSTSVNVNSELWYVYCKVQMVNACGRKTTDSLASKPGHLVVLRNLMDWICQLTKIGTNAYFCFGGRKSRLLLEKIVDKPKTLQIAFVLLYKLDELSSSMQHWVSSTLGLATRSTVVDSRKWALSAAYGGALKFRNVCILVDQKQVSKVSKSEN